MKHLEAMLELYTPLIHGDIISTMRTGPRDYMTIKSIRGNEWGYFV